MKSLFEATNGYTGQSYMRCYVWADSEEIALEMATSEFKLGVAAYGDDVFRNVRITKLFSSDSDSFVTKPSDDGFDLETL